MRRLVTFMAVALAVVLARPAAAQDGPRFLFSSASKLVPLDLSRTPVLGRRLALNLSGVTLKEALAAISKQSGLELVYEDEVVPLGRRVNLRADAITVAAALTDVLFGTNVDVVFDRSGTASLLRRKEKGVAQPGTVTGRMTDAKTGDALAGAEVYLEGTRWRATTGGDGRYRLVEVEPGNYTLVARRVGYGKQSRVVAVAAGAELTVDVALLPVATQLNEIVTTVTGDQRRVELGHVVGRINADSLVKEAPVASLSELLTARVPGLQVFQAQGTVGGEVRVRIRGPNSLFLSAEPIVILDGVRYTTTPRQGMFGGPSLVEPTGPLNDINPNDIESIEVVKGPSAVTLYGTDAANGVIVITTKRGRPGRAVWNAYARSAMTEIPPVHYPDIYWGWRTVGGTPSLTSSCYLQLVASGSCTQDSVTALPNPLNDPELAIFDSKPRWEYGMNVAGGQRDLRYYFATDFEDATGPIRIPPAIAQQLKEQRGLSELPKEWRDPNALAKLNLRANLTAALGASADLRVNTGYVHGSTRSLAATRRSPYSDGVFRTNPNAPYGGGFDSPNEIFVQTSTEKTDRLFGSANGQWRPVKWLATRVTIGLDFTSSNRYSLVDRGNAPSDAESRDGAVEDSRARLVAATAELGATATVRRGRLSSRTSSGVQYVRNLYDDLGSFGSDLPRGGTSVAQAAVVQGAQQYSETVTLGSYIEETLGLNDRLFLTGAFRVDGASSFGRNYDAAVYPKVSASWLVSEEPFLPRLPGLDELRLRYAFGASGQQPDPEWARPAFSPDRAIQNGQLVSTMRTVAFGNPDIGPERVREHEFGFDAAALQQRLRLSLAWYRRRTVDPIVAMALPPGMGSTLINLGLTTQRGFEAELSAQVVDNRLLSWNIAFQHGSHATRLVDIGEGVEVRDQGGGWVEGYPLGARFQQPLLGYEDTNGDGIIVTNEIRRGDTAVYVGQSTPPRSQALTTVLGLFEQRLRFSALLERRAGFTQINGLQATQCALNTCRAKVDRSTPLAEQAQALLPGGVRFPAEPGDFIRLREVAAAVDLPRGLARALRLSSATLAFSARNVALWTDFSGPDPESARLSVEGGLPGSVANGIPRARSWTLRLDLGF